MIPERALNAAVLAGLILIPVWALATYARWQKGLPTRQVEVINAGPIDLGSIPVLAAAT